MAQLSSSPSKLHQIPDVAARFGVFAYARRRKFATGAAAVLTVLLGYHVVFGQNGLTSFQQKRKDTKDLDVQVQSLTRQNEQLNGHVTRLQNDPNAIEHEAREELHYARPGEVIYTLPAPKSR